MTTERKKHHPIRRTRAATPPVTYAPRHEAREVELENEDAPRRERRALSHVGGKVHFTAGSDEERRILESALQVNADEQQVMTDVHGFHSYPARLHPLTARRLVEQLSRPGDRVLDPFCGSGTVVVEARALGRTALGSDLNPLSVELSWLKSRGPNKKLIADVVAAAARIAEVAEDRRLAKADPYARYSEEDRERYPIHTLLELDSIAHGISLVHHSEPQRILRLVVSSMLTKLANSEGDTTRRHTPRRLPGGFAIELFVQKTEELGRRLDSYLGRLPEKAPRAYVFLSDARELEKIESDSVDLIVTSPPYPGVYDYLDHHLHRIEWLGLRAGQLTTNEIGARRKYRRLRVEEAARLWQDEIGAVLYELRRTLAPTGRGVLVVADSVIDRRPMRADEQLRQVAALAGVDITAMASQERPLFLHGADSAFSERPRMEHVVIFRPGERPKRRAFSFPDREARRPEPSDDRSRRPGPAGGRPSRFEGRGSFEGRERFDRPARPPGRERFDRPERPPGRERFDTPERPPGRERFDRSERPEGRERFDRGSAHGVSPDRGPHRSGGSAQRFDAPRRTENRPDRSDRAPHRSGGGAQRFDAPRRTENRPDRSDRAPHRSEGGAQRFEGGARHSDRGNRTDRGPSNAQRDNQARTWDSSPGGAKNPRSKPFRKPR